MTYRAAYYRTLSGAETVLTGPEHASMPDINLLNEAIQEAYRVDLIGDEYPRITLAKLRKGLKIGDWTE